jgi:hypothetical protein
MIHDTTAAWVIRRAGREGVKGVEFCVYRRAYAGIIYVEGSWLSPKREKKPHHTTMASPLKYRKLRGYLGARMAQFFLF